MGPNISGHQWTAATAIHLVKPHTCVLTWVLECPRQSGPSSSSADDNDDEMLRMAPHLSSTLLDLYMYNGPLDVDAYSGIGSTFGTLR